MEVCIPDSSTASVGLARYPTNPTLGDLKPLLQILHSYPTPCSDVPQFTPFRRSVSTSSFSVSSFFRRAFSDSSCLRRLASRELIPPQWFLQRWKVASLIPRYLATSGTVEPEASLPSACWS